MFIIIAPKNPKYGVRQKKPTKLWHRIYNAKKRLQKHLKQPSEQLSLQDNSAKVWKVYEDFYLMSTPLGSAFWQRSQK